jgi:PAS domain S-box-containing protein
MVNDFGRVIDLLPGLVWTACLDGRADFVNQRWCEYTGLTREEASGDGWRVVVHPDDLSLLTERWGAMTASGVAGEMEARLRSFHGEYRWFLFRAEPITDADGALVGWCGINTDIEDRKRAEEALLVRDIHYRSVADIIPAMIAFMTPDGAAETVNRHVLAFFGRTLEEIKGWGTGDFVHPDDLPAVVEAWRQAVSAGEPYVIEHRMRRADGVYRWFRVNGLPLWDASGAIVRWYVLQTDIDDQKRAESLLAGEKHLLEMVAQDALLGDVLEELCRVVEANSDRCLCSVLCIDPDGQRFRRGAGPGLPAAYNELLDGLLMDYKFGPCGMAANWKEQVIAADLPADPRWKESPWPALVAAHGLRSCWATPIVSGDERVIGVFALYRPDPGDPTPSEQNLIRQFTHIASIAIERAQKDASLRQSNSRKSAILNSALDCIVTIDHEGHITEFNPAAERTFGYAHDAVVGRLLSDVIIPPAMRERHRQGLARYLSTGEATFVGRRIELTAMRADGSEFPVELAIALNPTDGPPSFTGYMRDITERRQAEERLKRSNAFLAEAQHISSTGSFSWRPATGEITWSEQVYRMFEFETDQPLTLELIATRVFPDDLHLLQDMAERAERGSSAFNYEHRLLMPDGAVKHLRLIGHRTRDRQGHMEYIGAVQDITERRVSEAALSRVRSELAQMSRITSLGALTASIAHEVNQPLSGIVTNANTCLRMLAADPPNILGAQETARRTVRDGNRAADVVKRLRALFSKRDATSEPVDLSEAAREVIALCSSDLERSRVILRAELSADLPPISGDRIQLQQVILNLLLNAADAMSGVEARPRQALIRTELTQDDQIKLIVQDVGVGLDPQAAERLFEAFYTTKKEGMGIGLSISRTIIENHGGRIWAEPNDGPGATFQFSVPYSSEDVAGVHEFQAVGRSSETASEPAMVKH